MNRQIVPSSNILSVGYDLRASTLEIQFRDGAVYQYKHVPQSIHEGLMDAPSKGKYFHRFIKGLYTDELIRVFQ